MNCVCGHEYDVPYWEEDYDKKKDFINLSITNDIRVIAPKSNPWSSDRSVNLYACPKCYTVRIDEI